MCDVDSAADTEEKKICYSKSDGGKQLKTNFLSLTED